jgi:cytidylate kinase
MVAGTQKKMIVAIDGPAGAGKSTIAKHLARELGYTYMDTGAMYRAFAWKLLQEGIDLGNEKELKRMLEDTQIQLVERNGVLLDGRDVTDRIRTPEVSQMASKASALKIVRERMVELQREMGRAGGIVAEGRDIGTVVFPDAEVKVYLDALPGERARRRFDELKKGGGEVTLEQTLGEMNERDRRDTERAVAPLHPAADAVVIDSTRMGIDVVVRRVLDEIEKKKSIPIH